MWLLVAAKFQEFQEITRNVKNFKKCQEITRFQQFQEILEVTRDLRNPKKSQEISRNIKKTPKLQDC